MFSPDGAFSGFSIRDKDESLRFYRDALGLDVSENEMGFLTLHLASGANVLAYVKGDGHQPASYTMLNFEVDDIDEAVDELNARGVVTTIYNGTGTPVDEKGIMRGNGPDIAWFTDPSGNVMAVIQASAIV